MGTFAQYNLPEGSTVEIYHAEDHYHRFNISGNSELKFSFKIAIDLVKFILVLKGALQHCFTE